jgi:hypothetical protein
MKFGTVKATRRLRPRRDGRESTLEVVEAYRSTDMVVLAALQRTHVEVGGLPAQHWALRVTLVFRKDGDEWCQVHRHADPLAPGISVEQAAVLARGPSQPMRRRVRNAAVVRAGAPIKAASRSPPFVNQALRYETDGAGLDWIVESLSSKTAIGASLTMPPCPDLLHPTRPSVLAHAALSCWA